MQIVIPMRIPLAHPILITAIALFVTIAQPARALESGDPGFGKQWIRQNPFTISADSLYPATWDFAEYFGAGMTLLIKDVGYNHTINPLNRPPQYATSPWQAFLPVPAGNPQAGINEFNTLRHTPYNVGWIISDEPNRLRMPDLGVVVDYIRQVDPSQLVYSNGAHIDWGAQYWYGNTSQPNYTYDNYLDDFVNIIKPDVLMYDLYGFNANDEDHWGILENIMAVRNKAKSVGIPYWSWLQGWGAGNARMPSESDNRYDVFAHLAAGYTGFQYWTYDYYASTYDGLIDINGNPTPLYYIAQQTHEEVSNLGTTLRFLESTDVRFVPGRHYTTWPFTAPNATPGRWTNWSSNAGGDAHITNVVVSNPLSNLGDRKNGMIGLFTDDEGDQYFMLTNLNHGQWQTAANASLGFTITFASNINAIFRLNRLTGVPERVNLSNHILSITLPGGTGDLFKYDNGYFAGITPGDADLDGDVDLSDLGSLASFYGQSTSGVWTRGDFDLDGDIDLNDLGVLATNYGAGAAQAFADFQTLASVPEPAGAGVMMMWAGAMRMRRRGR